MSRPIARLRAATLLLPLMIGLSLSACSDDDAASDTGTKGTSEPSPAPTSASTPTEDIAAALPKAPAQALAGKIVGAEELQGTWEVDVEIDAPRPAAARKIHTALRDAGFTTLRDDSFVYSSEYLSADYSVLFIVGTAKSTTPVHYTIRER